MDLSTRAALDKACLGIFFLLGLLQWHVKMGFKDKLAAMQSQLQKRKRHRFSIPQIGLSSLCSPEGLTSDTFDGCRMSYEKNFYTQKESLTRFASSSPALQRTSLFSKVSPSKFKFTQKESSTHDPHRLTRPASHAHDAHPSWRDTEGSILNDAHPADAGWNLISQRHSFKEPQHSPVTVRRPCESDVIISDASKVVESSAAGMTRAAQSLVSPVADAATTHKFMSLRHHGSAVAVADAVRILQPCTAHTLHPLVSPSEPMTTAADAGLAHKLVALRHRPTSPCESTAVIAADALVSLNDSTTAAASVDVTADARVSVCEMAEQLVSPHKPFARIDTISTACEAPQTSSSMARTGFAPLLGLPGSNKEGEVIQSKPMYKRLLESGQPRDILLKDLHSQIAATKSRLEALHSTRADVFARKRREALDQEELPTSAAFTPLSKEEEEEVHEALNGTNRHQVLVQHEPSNLELSRAALQCLKPGAWLNDEVINLYMELLKERERREQNGYLKCHFFNTFFFNKLYKDAHSYDFKAVRRWTTQRKLGYSLLECDKIFVPIHKDIHWCLAVINIREKKLQYLDSLKGHDVNVLQALARYIKDEAKDKGAEDVDTNSWHLDCPKDIPEQMNGCDCGMFMIKYADFLSRGSDLKFTQEHMEYFRKRTALELLQLKAR